MSARRAPLPQQACCLPLSSPAKPSGARRPERLFALTSYAIHGPARLPASGDRGGQFRDGDARDDGGDRRRSPGSGDRRQRANALWSAATDRIARQPRTVFPAGRRRSRPVRRVAAVPQRYSLAVSAGPVKAAMLRRPGNDPGLHHGCGRGLPATAGRAGDPTQCRRRLAWPGQPKHERDGGHRPDPGQRDLAARCRGALARDGRDAYKALRDNFCANVEAGAWILRRVSTRPAATSGRVSATTTRTRPSIRHGYLREVLRQVLAAASARRTR